MKIILITIGLLAAVGVVIFSYAVEAVNVGFDLDGNIVQKDSIFKIDLGDLGGGNNTSTQGTDGP